METADWSDCVARMRLLWPQATIAPEVAGEWWPNAQRWNRGDCWQAIEELAVELAFPPALAELAKRVAQKRFERGQAERDLVADAAAEYHVLRSQASGWEDRELLLQAMFRVGVASSEEDWVERRAAMQLGIEGYRPVDALLAERWRHVQALMLTQADVRAAYKEAAAAELDAETTLELMEAASA